MRVTRITPFHHVAAVGPASPRDRPTANAVAEDARHARERRTSPPVQRVGLPKPALRLSRFYGPLKNALAWGADGRDLHREAPAPCWLLEVRERYSHAVSEQMTVSAPRRGHAPSYLGSVLASGARGPTTRYASPVCTCGDMDAAVVAVNTNSRVGMPLPERVAASSRIPRRSGSAAPVSHPTETPNPELIQFLTRNVSAPASRSAASRSSAKSAASESMSGDTTTNWAFLPPMCEIRDDRCDAVSFRATTCCRMRASSASAFAARACCSARPDWALVSSVPSRKSSADWR